MLTQNELISLLDYDRATGEFRWIRSMGGKAKAGSIAGATDSKGYTQIRVSKRLYLAHRLAWLYVYGEWPRKHLDHIDRNPKNNAIGNLRECTHAENHQNVGVRSDSSSGITGVSFSQISGKWLAYITLSGKTIRLGLHETLESAIAARSKAKKKYHTFEAMQ